jgi:hypothetical protein
MNRVDHEMVCTCLKVNCRTWNRFTSIVLWQPNFLFVMVMINLR